MSFDEEDLDPHGECRHEINALHALAEDVAKALEHLAKLIASLSEEHSKRGSISDLEEILRDNGDFAEQTAARYRAAAPSVTGQE